MKKVLLILFLLAIVVGAVIGWPLYRAVYHVNTTTDEAEGYELFLQEGATFEELASTLEADGVLLRPEDFRRVAKLMKFGPTVKSGRYLVKDGLTSRELISKLRIGDQDEVKLIFNKFRTKDRFAGHISQYLNLDSADLHLLLYDAEWLHQHDLNTENVFTAFIPNTYFFKWDTDSEGFVERMISENQNWWEQNGREEKAAKLGLTPEEVYIVASIVEEESVKTDERPRIAGLYLNRLNIGMALQADPTIKFAIKRFELTRVLFKHIDEAAVSPYSTYANPGLPPGPICIPSTNSIEAVLNAEEHNYYYMCAKADLSGYHAFARNNAEHERNRALYRAEMNRLGY